MVGVLGLVIGLIANTANPNGLSLTRNYYPPRKPPVGKPHGDKPDLESQRENTIRHGPALQTGPATRPPPPAPTQDEELTEDQIIDNLEKAGFQAIAHQTMVEMYEDPFYKDGLYLIVDARSEALYQKGHIPGAYHLDYYYADRYVDAVMKAYHIADGVTAEKIVVYCNGGKCEDSELTADYLQKQGVDPHKVFIYGLGFTGWKARGMPIETGDRNSGNIVESAPDNGGSTTPEARK